MATITITTSKVIIIATIQKTMILGDGSNFLNPNIPGNDDHGSNFDSSIFLVFILTMTIATTVLLRTIMRIVTPIRAIRIRSILIVTMMV